MATNVQKQGEKVRKNVEAKLSAKHVASLRGIGEAIVEKTVNAGDSVAEMFFKVFGKKESELGEVLNGMADAWKAQLTKLKKQCAEYTSKLEARDSASAYSKQAQVYYNRASEGKAIIKAFGIYAALPQGTAKKKFEKDMAEMESAPRRYDTLVMYCRHINNPAKRDSAKPQNAAATRAKNAWSKKQGAQVKKVKDTLKFANLSGLLELREWIEDRIAMLKKKEPAEVINIKKQALRKAA